LLSVRQLFPAYGNSYGSVILKTLENANQITNDEITEFARAIRTERTTEEDPPSSAFKESKRVYKRLYKNIIRILAARKPKNCMAKMYVTKRITVPNSLNLSAPSIKKGLLNFGKKLVLSL